MKDVVFVFFVATIVDLTMRKKRLELCNAHRRRSYNEEVSICHSTSMVAHTIEIAKTFWPIPWFAIDTSQIYCGIHVIVVM